MSKEKFAFVKLTLSCLPFNGGGDYRFICSRSGVYPDAL